MISNIRSLNAYSYGNITHSGGASGKLYVPVNPGAVIYAQFNHISGVPAGKGQNGVSISKIQILNTLIDNLSRIKNTTIPKHDSVMSDGQAEALIKNYQAQIQAAAQNAKTAPFALAGAQPMAGALFQIDA
ncbi:MAG: hypothetical protein K5640_06155 [Treponema sp.]|nr:hypothetical protein [Treponema sp.]